MFGTFEEESNSNNKESYDWVYCIYNNTANAKMQTRDHGMNTDPGPQIMFGELSKLHLYK